MKRLIEDKIKKDKKIEEVFNRIFEIFEYEINLDKKIKEINPDLEKQTVTIIRDKILQRETIFNISRKKRGIHMKVDVIKDFYDPFCNGDKNTLADELGILENDKAKIVANIAKMAPFHSVLYFKKHEFDDLTFEDFSSAIDLSFEWFEKIENSFQTSTHILIWNYHFRAGASIYHPHFQLLAFYHHPFRIVDLKQKLDNYQKEYHSNYLDDYFLLMKNLELGFETDNFKIWFPLTPLRNNEFNFYGDLKKNAQLVWKVIEILIKSSVQSFNMIYFYKSNFISNFGLFGDRGEIDKLTSDIGTLEIFYHPVVSFDPFQVASLVFNSLKEKK